MSVLPFDQIVAKLDKWNAQRLATINERSTTGEDDQKTLDHSLPSVKDPNPPKGSTFTGVDGGKHKVENLNLKFMEDEVGLSQKGISKPMAASTPLMLSPVSQSSRRPKVFSASDAHSEVSSISKYSTENNNANFGRNGPVSRFIYLFYETL